jgi:hypothetical protein
MPCALQATPALLALLQQQGIPSSAQAVTQAPIEHPQGVQSSSIGSNVQLASLNAASSRVGIGENSSRVSLSPAGPAAVPVGGDSDGVLVAPGTAPTASSAAARSSGRAGELQAAEQEKQQTLMPLLQR